LKEHQQKDYKRGETLKPQNRGGKIPDVRTWKEGTCSTVITTEKGSKRSQRNYASVRRAKKEGGKRGFQIGGSKK